MCSRSFLALISALVCGMFSLPAFAADPTQGSPGPVLAPLTAPAQAGPPAPGGNPAVWAAWMRAAPEPATPTKAAGDPSADASSPWGRRGPPSSAPAPPELDTYSGHVLLADAAWIGGTVVVANGSEEGAVALAGGGYLFSGPLVHLAHERPKTAVASLVTRIGLPLFGALFGVGGACLSRRPGSCRRGEPGCDENARGDLVVELAAVGAALGVLAAPIVDAAVLARVDWFDKPSSPQSALAGPASRATMLHFGGAF